MYDINLIRKKLVPERHKNVLFTAASLAALAYVLTIVGLIVASLSNARIVDAYATEVEEVKQYVEVESPGAAPSAQRVELMLRRIMPSLGEAEALAGESSELTLLWAGVAEAVPDSVWVTSVRVAAPRAEAEGKRKGKARFSGIILEGSVAARVERGGELIRKFTQQLEEQEHLKERIQQARFEETEIQRIGGQDVIGFRITCPFL
jgi:hypothetical protein